MGPSLELLARLDPLVQPTKYQSQGELWGHKVVVTRAEKQH